MSAWSYFWIPEAPGYPGTFAPARYGVKGVTATDNIQEALLFETREACQAWCDQNPAPPYAPAEHGFLS